MYVFVYVCVCVFLCADAASLQFWNAGCANNASCFLLGEEGGGMKGNEKGER
jgi:hypothetical protein